MQHIEFEAVFNAAKEPKLHGRYVNLGHIQPLIESLDGFADVEIIGRSVFGKPIYACRFGSGKTKILMWSQMHGNESTTTKAVFDVINWMRSGSAQARQWLDAMTFYVVPMLNPDGAEAFTRENANQIDLNRDFCNLTQPESQSLLEVFRIFNPDYCFNLHDQRTIYGAGFSGKPATVSFLAPSYNEAREMNAVRSKAVDVIAAMNSTLQRYIPGQVGRFDDAFNINCVGDTFQYNNVPTILFEAGHFPQDYEREVTRKYIFISILAAIGHIFENVIVDNGIADYLNIPQNNINFYDFVYKNVKINYDGNEIITNFAAQYKEELKDAAISFVAYIEEISTVDSIYGHFEYDAKQQLFKSDSGKPAVGQKADFQIGDTTFSNGIPV